MKPVYFGRLPPFVNSNRSRKGAAQLKLPRLSPIRMLIWRLTAPERGRHN